MPVMSHEIYHIAAFSRNFFRAHSAEKITVFNQLSLCIFIMPKICPYFRLKPKIHQHGTACVKTTGPIIFYAQSHTGSG